MPLQDIDMDKVRRVAERAQIADVIESRPGGYTARVGESGLKFSGGQRQRIAIARALYKSASVIVLDEATSSLDDITEEEVMSTMRNLGRELTIITVAHRIGSLRDCDRIFRIKSGILKLENFSMNKNQ
jgi:ATP-binding cassette subfamily B protein